MALPNVPLPTDTVDINGESVPIKSLSRDAVLRLSNMGDDAGGAEIMMLSLGTGVTEAEAKAWRETTDAPTADKLLQAIARLSGISRGKAGNA